MEQATLLLRVSILAVVQMSASHSVVADPNQTPVPCIDTKPSQWQAVLIELAEEPAGQPQAVIGTLMSWDPEAHTVGFKAEYSRDVEQIPVKSIRLSFRTPSMAAQAPIPTIASLGTVSETYAGSDVSIDFGVIRFPNCALPSGDHAFGFDGSIVFTGNDVHVEGEVKDVEPPRGGGSPDHLRGKGG
jgi:hypothetical protein